jgi:hypothetical protein
MEDEKLFKESAVEIVDPIKRSGSTLIVDEEPAAHASQLEILQSLKDSILKLTSEVSCVRKFNKSLTSIIE